MIANRREFLKRTAGFFSIAALAANSRRRLFAHGAAASENHFEVVSVDKTTVKLEFRPTPRRNMDREIPHWRYIELCQVRLKSGHVGTGETMLYYTWGVPSEQDVKRVIGKSAIELMWDDTLGAGLQMAMFDAVGRTAQVPVHALLGRQVHSTTPLSWWNIDTSAADMASECKEALRLGYMSYKTKGRPWFDIFHQLETATVDLPNDFKIDMDFNDTLLTAEQGLPIIRKIAKYPQVDIYETPIPQSDVEGNRRICDATQVQIAMHYGRPSPRRVVESGCCDGFVAGHGASELTAAGNFCEEVKMPFWLQLVGAGMTAAFSLHFGGVLKQARWPAVNCHQLFENDLLQVPVTLSNGHAVVPDAPGIGYEVDWDAVEQLKVARPDARPEPQRLIETTWSSGRRMYTANNGKVNFMLTAANQGKYPYYEAGADTRLLPDDGTDHWKQLYARARREGPIEA
ncbi:MAG: mandelate racemase/muconate lactonizing enzyme family protein [Fuerstiella sp.]|nr:mandelate racemase/muconate lactonizing enzyme family protein [Fuerstiella sp.]